MDTSSDYYESDNFKRNNHGQLEEESTENLKNYDYIRELIKERNQLESDSHASRLLDQGKLKYTVKLIFLNIFIDFPLLFRNPACKNQWQAVPRHKIR